MGVLSKETVTTLCSPLAARYTVCVLRVMLYPLGALISSTIYVPASRPVQMAEPLAPVVLVPTTVPSVPEVPDRYRRRKVAPGTARPVTESYFSTMMAFSGTL